MAGPITIAVLADVANARRNLAGVEGDVGGLGGKVSKLGMVAKAGFLAAGAAAVGFGVQAVRAASDSQQSLGATETVFGKFASSVIKDSKSAAQAYGLSANEYRENANLIGSLFKNQGVAMDELGGKTKGMIGQAADLAATFGGTTKDAVEALGSAFKGEFDPLEKYGISIKQSTVNAELAARGQDKLTGAALKQAQQIALTDLVMKQSADSTGAFARESNTLAGQTQRLGAQWENIKATVGTALLPVLTALAAAFNEQVLPAISAAWSYLSTKLGPVFATVKGYVDQVTASFGGGGGGLAGAVATVQAVFGQVVAVVGPIVQALVGLVRDNWSKIVSWTKATFAQVRSTVQSSLGLVRQVITTVLSVIQAVWNRWGDLILSTVKTVFSALAGIVRGALNIVQGIIRTVTAVLRGDWSAAWSGIQQILKGAWQVIVSIVRGAGALLKAAATVAFDLLKSAVKGGIQAAVAIVKGFPGLAVKALAGAGKALYGVGQNIVQGLLEGIRSLAGSITTTLVGLLPGPLQKFAGKLGIQSPSKVFEQFGKYVGEGFIKGIVGTKAHVLEVMGDLADKVKETHNAGMIALVNNGRTHLAALGKIYDDVSTRVDNTRDRLKALQDAAAQMRQAVTDSIVATGNVTSFDPGTDAEGNPLPVTYAAIAAGMTASVDKAKAFASVITDLRKQGLNQTTIDQLVQAGPEKGLAAAQAILAEGKKAIAEVNKLEKEIIGAGKRVANQAAKNMYDAGIQAAQGLLDALESREGALAARMRRYAEIMAQTLRRGLDIHSPSRVFAEIGRMVGAGLVVGVDSTVPAVRSSVAGLVDPDALALPALAAKRPTADDPADLLRGILQALQNLPRAYRLNERTATA